MSIKIAPSILMSFLCISIFAQEASEIYLFDLIEKDSAIHLVSPVNISNNPGYDNQPCFSEDGKQLFFSSERNGQTDIAIYDIEEGYRTWITDTEESEYSPAPYPSKKKYFTCVRNNNGESQLLYKYAFKKRPPEVMLPEQNIAYYLWKDEKNLVSFLIDETEILQVTNFKYDINYPIQYQIGRSICKVPIDAGLGHEMISFISLQHEAPEIYAINIRNSKTKYLGDAIEQSKDLAWTKKGKILMASGAIIYQLVPDGSSVWIPVQIECDLPLSGITRLAVSPDGGKIAIVVQE